MNLGKAIKTLLDTKGMTQKQLAAETNLSPTSISLLMKGHTKPRKETLDLVANALDVKPEFLLLLSLSKEDVPDDKRALYDLIWPQLEATFVKLFVK
jgi:transcriptional regulator with XRE-family HTH domain